MRRMQASVSGNCNLAIRNLRCSFAPHSANGTPHGRGGTFHPSENYLDTARRAAWATPRGIRIHGRLNRKFSSISAQIRIYLDSMSVELLLFNADYPTSATSIGRYDGGMVDTRKTKLAGSTDRRGSDS